MNFHGSFFSEKGKERTWQLPLEHAVEEVKKMEEMMSGRRRRTICAGDAALHCEHMAGTFAEEHTVAVAAKVQGKRMCNGRG